MADELNEISTAEIAELEDEMEDVGGQDDDYVDDGVYHSIKPDATTKKLLAEIASNKDRFRSACDVIDQLRPSIIALKTKFKVRQGHKGIGIFIEECAQYTQWNEYCQYMFGVTAHRMNQLLNEKDKPFAAAVKKPDCEKPMFKKGYKAAVEETVNKLEAAGINVAEALKTATPPQVTTREEPKPFIDPKDSYAFFETFKAEPQTMASELASMLIEFNMDDTQLIDALKKELKAQRKELAKAAKA
jgi:hypothetical protein